VDEAAFVLAVIGALTGPAALGWQIFTWQHARKVKVGVSVSYGLIGFDEPESVVMVTVTNDNDFDIRITSAGFVMQDSSGREYVVVHPPPLAGLPGVVTAHDSAMTYLTQDEAERAGIDVYRPLTGWARTATGERFTSKPVTLLLRD
jgi:hypothetical protein